MTRETKELTTPLGHKAVVYTYLTAREVDGVLREIFGTRESSGDKTTVPMVLGLDRNQKLVQAALTSFDGVTDKPLDVLLELPASEYAFILKQVQSLADGNF